MKSGMTTLRQDRLKAFLLKVFFAEKEREEEIKKEIEAGLKLLEIKRALLDG
jgi:hypothetical protein